MVMPCFIFNYLIKNGKLNFFDYNERVFFSVNKINFVISGFINELVKFSIKKIPNSSQSLTNIPIAYSLSQILNRCFSFLYYISTKSPLSHNINSVVNSLVNELFAQANSPQVKCLVENMSEIFFKSSSELKADEGQTSCISYLGVFLSQYHKLLSVDNSNMSFNKSSSASEICRTPSNFDKSDVLKIYSLFKISSRIFGKYSLLSVFEITLITYKHSLYWDLKVK